MTEIPGLINDLALILVVASIVTLIFKKLKQPLILGYIVAGFLVSPHMPYIMSITDKENIHLWSEIGVLFLMFSLGLEFSFKNIIKSDLSPIIATVTLIAGKSILGFSIGRLFNWDNMDCIFLGGMIAVSSTTVIYKALNDLGIRQQKFADNVIKVLILEDILAILMMVILTTIAVGNGTNGGDLIGSIGKIVFFLILWFVVGIFVVPYFLRSIRKLASDETLLIISLGLCCMMVVLSAKAGFSSALGAFVMGSILAETIEAERINHLVEPVKNLFGAIFFVSVGMLVDPNIILNYGVPILLLVIAILIGCGFFGTLGFMLGGVSMKSAIKSSFSLSQIGEFSFIIASLGLSLGVISDFVYPVIVSVSVITAFITPYSMKYSEPFYNYLEKKIPAKWFNKMNRFKLLNPTSTQQENNIWKSLLMQISKITLIYSIISIASITLIIKFLQPILLNVLPTNWANIIVGLVAIIAISPFLRAMVMKKNNSEEFKSLWNANILNRFPLIFTITVRFFIAMGFVFYICNQLSNSSNALLLTISIAIILLVLQSKIIKKRSMFIEKMFVLNLNSRDIAAQVRGLKKPLYANKLLDRDVHISNFIIPDNSLWIGKTLSELKFGNRFGVHVASIFRGRTHRMNIPGGRTILFTGDKIEITGSDAQLAAFSNALNTEVFEEDIDIEKREMHLKQIVITDKCPFLNKTLKESGLRDKYNCMLVGLEEGKENLSQPNPLHVFKEGDIVWIIGEESSLSLFSN